MIPTRPFTRQLSGFIALALAVVMGCGKAPTKLSDNSVNGSISGTFLVEKVLPTAVAAGDLMTITGIGLTADAQFRVGGQVVPVVSRKGDTEVVVQMPEGTPGQQEVAVSKSGESSSTSVLRLAADTMIASSADLVCQGQIFHTPDGQAFSGTKDCSARLTPGASTNEALGDMGCEPGQTLRWSGKDWECGAAMASSEGVKIDHLTGSAEGEVLKWNVAQGKWVVVKPTSWDDAANAVSSATSTATASKLVVRDAFGNFSAGDVTANRFIGQLTGNADTATTATTATNVTGIVGIANGGLGSNHSTANGVPLFTSGSGVSFLQAGMAPNNLVQLNASGQLPAISGANLTNLNAGALASGTVPNGAINWASPDPIGATSSSSGAFTTLTTSGNVGVGTTLPGAPLDVKGTIRMSGATSGFVGFAPAAAAGSTVYTLPSAPVAGSYLKTDGGGLLTWEAPSGAGDITEVTAGTGLSGGATAGTASLAVTYGNSAGTAAEGNDARLSDPRAPNGSAGGDLSNSYPSPTVARLQGRPVDATAPSNNHYLMWNGTSWIGAAAGSVTSVDTGNGLTGGPIAGTGTIDLRLNATGGLSKALGTGTNELGIAASGVTNDMLQGSISQGKITNLGTDLAAKGDVFNGTQPIGALTVGTNNASAMTLETNNAARVTIDATGLVGVGTTAPKSPLQVNGSITADATGGAALMFNSYSSGGDRYLTNDSAFEIWHNKTSDVLSIGAAPSGTADASAAFTDALNIRSNGNVGIDTTSPVTKLDVVGSARIRGSQTSVLSGDINPAASTTVVGSGTSFLSELAVGDRIVVSGESRTVMSITSNTNLTVDTAFSNTGNDTTPDRYPAEFSVKRSNDLVDFIISNSGNVGIGTTAPLVPLHIHETADQVAFQVDSTAAGTTPLFSLNGQLSTDILTGKAFEVKANGETYARSMFYTDGKIGFGGGTAMRDVFFSREAAGVIKVSGDGAATSANLVVTGNIGIGTTNPSERLHVEGDAKVSGELIVESILVSDDPTAGDHAVNKDYADTKLAGFAINTAALDNGKVLAWDTGSGTWIATSAPVADTSVLVAKAGSTMTGDLNLTNAGITLTSENPVDKDVTMNQYGATFSPTLVMKRALGTQTTPASVGSGNRLGVLDFQGYDHAAGGFQPGAKVEAVTEAVGAGNTIASSLQFWTENGDAAQGNARMAIAGNGRVTIQTPDVAGPALSVGGPVLIAGTGGNTPHACTVRSTALDRSASCNTGEIAVGGGGQCTVGSFDGSVPVGSPPTGWSITCTHAAPVGTAYAICCDY